VKGGQNKKARQEGNFVLGDLEKRSFYKTHLLEKKIPQKMGFKKKTFFPQIFHVFFLKKREKRRTFKTSQKEFNREARQIRHQLPHRHLHHQSHLVQRFPRYIHSHR